MLSCKTLLTEKYRFNKPFSFESKSLYLEYLKSKYGFPAEHVLYPDSTSRDALGNDIIKAKLAQYYGTFINDTLEVRKTELLSENLSCIGQVLKEIENNSNDNYGNGVAINKNFRNYHFKIAVNDSDFIFNSDKKIKIFLLYAFAMGSYFDNFFRDVMNWVQNKNGKLEVFIIDLDPIQNLKR
jgi:hypothetical protein